MKDDDVRLKNLKPFKKGQSGNPSGRKEGSKNLSTMIRNALYAKGENGGTVFDDMTLAQIKKAMDGDTAAFKELSSRLEGTPIQKSETHLKVDKEPDIIILQEALDNGDLAKMLEDMETKH